MINKGQKIYSFLAGFLFAAIVFAVFIAGFNFVLAAMAGAAGALQIATIAASPYAQGGFARGGNIPASDTIPAMLSPNEIVSTSAASERFGAEIQRLNQIADGGGFWGWKWRQLLHKCYGRTIIFRSY